MKKPLLFGIILTVCVVIVAFVFAQFYPEGMISYWKFDEGSGLTASDSADENDGTIYGATFTTGQVNGALSFDGLDDYVEIPDDNSLDITGDLTLEAWIEPARVIYTAQGEIIGKWVQGDTSYWFAIRHGQLQMRISATGSDYYNIEETSDANLIINTWYHVVGVYDASEQDIKLYINGVVEESTTVRGTIPSSIHSGSANVKIGGWWPGYYFDGKIDEVAIYDRALIADEIQWHYEYGLIGLGYDVECVPSGMVSWWPGDGNAYDIVDGNDGTVNGATFATGMVGEAFFFDGVDDFVQINDNSNLHVQELTIDAWVYFDGTALKLQYFLRKWLTSDGGFGSFAGFRREDNRVAFTVQNRSLSAWPSWSSTETLAPGWHHIAFTWKPLGNFDASDGKIYIDGSEISTIFAPSGYSGGFSIEYANLPLYFGKPPTPGWAEDYEGGIDEVEIFNRALPASEIQAIYDADSAGKCKGVVIKVKIDIKPGSYPNCFNSNEHGVIPVAILGSADFDVTEINPFTVTLDGQLVRVKGKSGNAGSFKFVNDDEFMDLVVQITDEGAYSVGDSIGIITAKTYEGDLIIGKDTICITQ